MFSQQKVACPFNKAHTFAKQKFIFHIQRCKDKQKVIHLYTKCQYNPLHFVLKEDIQLHECCCPSREESLNLVEKLKNTFKKVRQQRQRSRQRRDTNLKKEECEIVKLQQINEESLQQCCECQEILRVYKKEIMNSENKKLKNFILKVKIDNQEHMTKEGQRVRNQIKKGQNVDKFERSN